ncbi:MAG: CAP domain-containing protein [Minisyncoccia bacterium]
MNPLLLLLLLTLFVPWRITMVSEDLASHSSPSPVLPKEVPAIAETRVATTTPKKTERAPKAAPLTTVTPPSSTAPVSKEPLEQIEPQADVISLIEAAVLRRSNEERSMAGLSPLAPDAQLRKIAWAHSVDMFTNEYFSHENTAGCSSSCRATNAGYAWRAIGENIYMMSGYDDAPEEKARRVVDGWMNSPGHRANILGAFTVSGVGVVSSDGHVYVTSLYAKPK